MSHAEVTELWMPIRGYEGLYEVSDRGRVRSLPRVVPGRGEIMHPVRGRLLKPSVDPGGYHRVKLSRDGRGRYQSVHLLVLQEFVGPCPEGHEAAHWDGVPSNNAVANLRWATHLENMADQVRHGTTNRGTRHPRAKLTETQVREIRSRRGQSITSIAVTMGVPYGRVYQVLRGLTWKYVADVADQADTVLRVGGGTVSKEVLR